MIIGSCSWIYKGGGGIQYDHLNILRDMRILSEYIPYDVANIPWNWFRMSLDLILNITPHLNPTQTPPKKCKNIMAIFSPLKLSNLVRYVHNMMGNFIQESCDQSRGGGVVTKKFILDHKGAEGSWGGSKTDHVVYEWPLRKYHLSSENWHHIYNKI